ncbi:sulfatase family protein [Pedosphaera parvula]|nr:arylsulfatase [Pedosphaera parvula]
MGRSRAAERPNIVLILADDLGYGDVSCYGATKVQTPNIDKVAESGLRFLDAHSSSATCTPSRYALLTGEYPWRKKGTGILPGDANLIIKPGSTTLPEMLRKGGYKTGAVGKWHLGLGDGEIDWNTEIKPGPLEIGFDYSFIMPATADRVPCVFVENHRVVDLDAKDPIQVSFKEKVGSDPTGQEHPELLKMRPSHGHDMTIVNGISRIGYMSGGKSARWVDEELAQTLTKQAVGFIEKNKDGPFFLYFATHDIHVPRVPNARFAGKSGMGPRGDVILQFDWTVGEIVKTLRQLKLEDNTILIVTSDNGPVVDDGYQDQAREKLNGHRPAGPLRGGKYSAFEGGTRVPFILSWPGHVKSGVSDALICQIDFLASFAQLTGCRLNQADGPDSLNILPAFVGDSKMGRDYVVEHAFVLALRKGNQKFIEPGKGPKFSKPTATETGIDPDGLFYDLTDDIGETNNLSIQVSEKAKQYQAELEKLRKEGRSRP